VLWLVNKIADFILCYVVHTFYQDIPYIENVMVSWFMHKCNIIYTCKKSTAFTMLIFMKVANSEQPYMQIY
jgi:hypothetical protein